MGFSITLNLPGSECATEVQSNANESGLTLSHFQAYAGALPQGPEAAARRPRVGIRPFAALGFDHRR